MPTIQLSYRKRKRPGNHHTRRRCRRRQRLREKRHRNLTYREGGGSSRSTIDSKQSHVSISKRLYSQWTQHAAHASRALAQKEPFLQRDLQRLQESSLYNEIPAAIRERIAHDLPLTPTHAAKLQVTLKGSKRSATIYLALPESASSSSPPPLDKYLELVVQWLLLVSSIAQAKCSPHLDVYLLLVDQPKQLTDQGEDQMPRRRRRIAPEDANTAFTFACPSDANDIVVFRREEWFKVLIHETYHAFGLDFASLTAAAAAAAGNEVLRRLFPRLDKRIDLHISETYSEVWAEWWQCLLAAQGDPQQLSKLLQDEQSFALFQANKVLRYAGGWSYENMMEPPTGTDADDDDVYREDTAAFAYYVLRAAALFRLEDFMEWCQRTNNRRHIMQFIGSPESVASFCQFLETCCKRTDFREAMAAMHRAPPAAFATPWFRKTMRMTVTDFV